MSLPARYAAAIFQDTYRVLGLRLVPFSLGHALLLERLGSPYLTGERALGRADIALAALICSRPPAEASRQLGSRWFRLQLWWIGRRRRRLAQAHRTLEAYLAAAYDGGPPVWTKPLTNGSRRCQAPFILQLELELMRQCHMTEPQALATPLPVALWLFAANGERDGSTQFMSSTESEIIASLTPA